MSHFEADLCLQMIMSSTPSGKGKLHQSLIMADHVSLSGIAVSPATQDAELVNDQLFKPEGSTPSIIPNFQTGVNYVYKIPPGSGVNRRVTHGAGVNIPSEYLGFYFSGLQSQSGGYLENYNENDNPSIAANTMVKVDMSQMGFAQWESLPLDSSVTARGGASLAWLPFGTQGLLVALGGVSSPADAFANQSAKESSGDSAFMTKLSIYDVKGEKWYTQSTTGDSPPPTADACAVVAHENGTNSYQIYVYGGYSGDLSSEPYNNIWILSVPSFEWKQVISSDADGGRYGHICVTPYPDQMLVIGGAGGFQFQPLPGGKMVQILNLTSLEWNDEYNPSVWAEYTIPDAVKSQNNLNQPAASMDPELANLFQQPYETQTTIWYPYTTPSSSGTKWLAPVLGGVLGGVAIAVTAYLTWLFRRRKTRRASQPATSETQGADSQAGVENWRRNVKSMASSGVIEIDSSDRSTVNNDPQEPVEIAGRIYVHAPRSPRSPNLSAEPPHSPSSGAAEVSGDASPRQELQDTSPIHRPISHVPSMTEKPDYRFRNHPLFPINVNDTMSVAESALTSGRDPVSSVDAEVKNETLLSSRADPLGSDDFNQFVYGRPPPIPPKQPLGHGSTNLHHHPSTGRFQYDNFYPGDPLPSPVIKELPTGTRPNSHAGRAFQISPLELGNQSPITGIVGPQPTTSNSHVATESAALPAIASAESNEGLIRPAHQRNASSQSSGMKITTQALPPSPDPVEDNRRSAVIDAMPEHPSAGTWPQSSSNTQRDIGVAPSPPSPSRMRRKEVGSPTSYKSRSAYEENVARLRGGNDMI